MKPSSCILFLCGCFLLTPKLLAQQSSIVFSYDASGKITQRSVQVVMGARIGKFDTHVDSLTAFKVYPNPTNQFINIEGELPEGVQQGQILLLNVNGQILKTDTYAGEAKSIGVSDLKPGLYLLEMKYSKTQRTTYKIVVSN